MDSGLRARAGALILLALGGLAQPAEASHFRYGTLSWAPTGNPSEVRFRLTAAFRRTEFGPVNVGSEVQENIGPTILFFGDGDVTVPLIFRVTAVSVAEDWFVGEVIEDFTPPLGTPTMGVTHTYPAGAPGPFTAFLGGIGSPNDVPPVIPAACCRIADPANPQPGEENLNNRAGLAFPLQTLVFPLSGNSSPVSTMVPIVVVPPSTTATFLVPAVDPDGDVLTWRLSTDNEAGGPAHPPGITVNASTGLVTWNNLTSGPGGTALEQAPSFWTTQFMIEDHDTVASPVKTKTPVDFLLQIRPLVGSLPACSISPGGSLSATVGNPVSFTVTGTDPDLNEIVTLNAGALPFGAAMTPALPFAGASGVTSTFNWTPAAADVGTHVVIFSATDTDNQQGLCQTSIEVIQANVAGPTCTISAHPATVQEGTPLTFTVTGTDPDAGDTVILDVMGALPSGATMTPALPFSGTTGVTSTFDWTPAAGQAGPYTFTFTATDSLDRQAQCQTSVEVVANPNPPTCEISPPGPFSVQAGTPVTFTVTGTDTDPGDNVTVDLDGTPLPPGATMTPALPVSGSPSASSVFNWTPAAADEGPHTIAFAATDSAGQSTSCQATVTVTVQNRPPTCDINPLGPQIVPIGMPASFVVTGTDPDTNDLVDLVVTSGAPAGAVFTPVLPIIDGTSPVSSTLNWTPVAGQEGLVTFAFQVTDVAGLSGTCSTQITVVNPTPPTCAITPVGPQTVPAGTPVSFVVTGTDQDLTDLVDLAVTSAVPAGTAFTPALPILDSPSPVISTLNWTPTALQDGTHVFTFLVTDVAGQTGTCQTQINVTPIVNANPPTCTIVPAGPQLRARGMPRRELLPRRSGGPVTIAAGTPVTFTVTGDDADVGDLLDLALTSGPLPAGAGLAPPLPITDAPAPVSSRFDWTPTAAQTGSFTFSFLVTDLAGQTASCETIINVTANNPPTCEISPHPPTVDAGTPFTFTVTGTDPDAADVLDLMLTSVPVAGATFAPPLPILDDPTPVASTLSWTPDISQAGPHTFAFLVTDAAGLQATCETTVTVTNPNPPTCTISPHPPTVLAGTPFGFTVTGADPDQGDLLDLALTSPPVLGAVFTPLLPINNAPSPVNSTLSWTPTAAQAGPQTFAFLVTDLAGQTDACSTTVNVIANLPPTITCPGPVNIEGCNVAGGQQVTLTVHVEDPNGDALTVTWRVDGVVVQVDNVPAGGPPTSANVTLTHVFGLGTHTVQVSVSDGQATAVSCETSVTIRDTSAPVLTCSSAQPMLWPPNHDLVNVGFRSQASDACDPSIVPLVQVFADEDDEEQTGDGHHSPDAKNIRSGSLRLRSERKGDANGRVYLMLAEGTDDSGNTGLQCCAVTVPHSQSKKDKDSVLAQARAAVAACQATGEPPPGFFVVGDGPILGPKQ